MFGNDFGNAGGQKGFSQSGRAIQQKVARAQRKIHSIFMTGLAVEFHIFTWRDSESGIGFNGIILDLKMLKILLPNGKNGRKFRG